MAALKFSPSTSEEPSDSFLNLTSSVSHCFKKTYTRIQALQRLPRAAKPYMMLRSLPLPRVKSHVIWNYKGGVGKTTLTYHMATEYARSHPSETVLVIDLSPQPNASLALLGSQNFNALNVLMSQEKTISFYLHQANSGWFPYPDNYLTHVSFFNNKIPKNIKLLCGDIYLEMVGRFLEQTTNAFNLGLWDYVTSLIRHFIEGVQNSMSRIGAYNDLIVFIDTSPSFSVLTEMALLAAERLIIPVNADDFSREALKAVLYFVYGIVIDPYTMPFPFKLYRAQLTLNDKARMLNLRLPKIHLVINNRVTMYASSPAKAFDLMGDSILQVLRYAFKIYPWCFTCRGFIFFNPAEDHMRNYFVEIQDFHTVGIVALHTGCPLANLSYLDVPFLGGTIQLNRTQINRYLQSLQRLVEKLSCEESGFRNPCFFYL